MTYRIDIKTPDGPWREYGSQPGSNQAKATDIYEEATKVHARVRLVQISETILAEQGEKK